jgi:hypothetical protein
VAHGNFRGHGTSKRLAQQWERGTAVVVQVQTDTSNAHSLAEGRHDVTDRSSGRDAKVEDEQVEVQATAGVLNARAVEYGALAILAIVQFAWFAGLVYFLVTIF